MAQNQYFLCDARDVAERQVLLIGDEAHHAVNVLRKKIGDRFFVVDGIGHEFFVELVEVEKDNLTCAILEKKVKPRELSVEIVLGQALIKSDHFDTVCEKAVELGVHTIIPLRTERSLVEPKNQKLIRWKKIIEAATKQSRRSVLAELTEIQSLSHLIGDTTEFDLKLMCHENAKTTMNEIISDRKFSRILILIGPEGGFTESEAALAVEHQFDMVSLGERRLRAETAALCAVSYFSLLQS